MDIVRKRRISEDVMDSTELTSSHSDTNRFVNKRNRSMNQEVLPSPVVLIIALYHDVTPQEVALLATPFGRISRMIIAMKKNQALIEMTSLDDAISMHEYYSNYSIKMHGKTVIIHYSKYEKLSDVNNSKSVDDAVEEANRIYDQDLPNVKSGDPNCVLRVQIERLMEQKMNHIILLKIFRPFGDVLRMVNYTKNDRYICFIEFASYVQAFTALLHLNGQNIYAGCCSLAIDFSKQPAPLIIRQENEHCRDYTTRPLTVDEENSLMQKSPEESSKHFGKTASSSSAHHSMTDIASQLSNFARQSGIALTQQTASAAASLMVLNSSNSGPAFGGAQRQQINELPFGQASPVLIVSNLHPDNITVDGLFFLFNIYGNVLRVKILFKNKSTAFIQFEDPQQVDRAISNFHNKLLFGRPMKMAHSRYAFVQLPKMDEAGTAAPLDSALTKDYTNSTLHRFRRANSQNYANIYPPSPVLHLSNIPENTPEESITSVFSAAGFTVKSFRFISNNMKVMGLITLANSDEAMQAVMLLHNYQLTQRSHLRVTFSKNFSA